MSTISRIECDGCGLRAPEGNVGRLGGGLPAGWMSLHVAIGDDLDTYGGAEMVLLDLCPGCAEKPILATVRARAAAMPRDGEGAIGVPLPYPGAARRRARGPLVS